MNNKRLVSAALTTILIAGIAVIVLAVGGGSAKTPPHPTAAGSAIGTRITSLGTTLVDAQGRTLYLFEGDRANVSRLSSAGLSVWPRFTGSATVKAVNGAQASKLGMITSPSGVRQVTYGGHPLYYYVGDTKPGSTRGQRLNQFGALWYVLDASGKRVTSTSSTTKPASGTPVPNNGY
jgi:predicted lipoprotein with Yx(FWY)xxD motif